MVRRKSGLETGIDSEQDPAAGRHGSSDDCSELWKAFGPAVAIALTGFAVAWMYMAPAPPKEITIAAGHRDGAYYRFCTQYATRLARNGITLNIRETNGSVENYDLLISDDDVDIAIVQGGTAPSLTSDSTLETVACLYPEPLWIFCRGDSVLSDIRELRGLRVAVGPQGSGTRCMSEQVLRASGLSAASRSFYPDSRTGFDAAVALRRGELDAAFFVTSADSGYIEELIRSPAVNLVSLKRQAAYAQLFPWMLSLTLAQGVVDLQTDLPSRDIKMIAPAANLVASTDLHEAFIPLFLKAAQEVHSGGGLFVRPGDFPNVRLSEHPLNASAAEYFKHGPSLFDRYLPFWVSSLISRTRILLVPMLTLLIPLVRLTPPIYRWRIRSRIYRWYEVLRRIDQQLSDQNTSRSVMIYRTELERIEKELQAIDVPLSYMEEFYNLRMHLKLVSRRINEQHLKRAA
ncbi:MAG: TAXI family TRAP transporter solute-binding subunit [Fuerstiella sp.]|nr:TAXI family TRAP transporter solute-binding subunit [Fuerstiella sp.]